MKSKKTKTANEAESFVHESGTTVTPFEDGSYEVIHHSGIRIVVSNTGEHTVYDSDDRIIHFDATGSGYKVNHDGSLSFRK